MDHLKSTNVETHVGKKVELICPVCQKPFVVFASDRKRRSTDSPECAAILNRKFNPSADELLQQMWKHPQAQIAKTFGIRTVTLQARCKKSDILRPPLGYWRLMQLGWSRNDALKHLGWPNETLAFLDEKLGKSAQSITVNPNPPIDYLTGFDWRTVPIKTMSRGLFFYEPAHPLAYKTGGLRGIVNLTRHIASVQRGEWLKRHEMVRYQDGNEKNIDPDNLVVVNRRNSPEKANPVELICPVCKKSFVVSGARAKWQVVDAKACALILRRKFNPTADELWKLVWNHPQREIARMFSTSSSIVRDRCRELGVIIPPMGYWNIIKMGRSHEDALTHLGWRLEEITHVNSVLK